MKRLLDVVRSTQRALRLVWDTDPRLLAALLAMSFIAATLPLGVAWTGRGIVDAVLRAAESGAPVDRSAAMQIVGLELLLVAALAGTQRGLDAAQSLLRVKLGHRVNVLILEKTLTLDLVHFEDSELYDQLTRARREASSRPLSLANRALALLQNTTSLIGVGALLVAFSPLAVLALAVAAIPAFTAETRFAGEAFRLASWRTPETREQGYLEVVVAREDYAKEVQLLGIGPRLVRRYIDIFHKLYGEDRALTLRRTAWGTLLGWVSTGALYGAYAWIALAAIDRRISLGEMTMYLLIFKQGQSAFSAGLRAVGGMLEDDLYLANLTNFLALPVQRREGGASQGTTPGDGLRFEKVCFTYPGATTPAVVDVDLHLRPGQRLALVGHNGSGKTTLVKLLTGLYSPQSGRVLLDGLPLDAWDPTALRRRLGVIFQDFVRYQFTVGENIGVGDEPRMNDRPLQQRAAERGMALPFIEQLPDGFDTQLGKWFRQGRELSGGQWQKVALSRAFMRQEADLLVFDEPTAAMDAEAEAEVFDRVRSLTDRQMAILISHRFSTVRMADFIIVLDGGRVVEEGDHASLMAADGRYANLFRLQAAGYR